MADLFDVGGRVARFMGGNSGIGLNDRVRVIVVVLFRLVLYTEYRRVRSQCLHARPNE